MASTTPAEINITELDSRVAEVYRLRKPVSVRVEEVKGGFIVTARDLPARAIGETVNQALFRLEGLLVEDAVNLYVGGRPRTEYSPDDLIRLRDYFSKTN